jgi:hypothetical protein
MKINMQESYGIQYNTSFDDSLFGDVIGYLMVEGLTDSEAGARIMIQGMSEEWFDELVIEAQEFKVKHLKRREMRKGEGLNNYGGKGKRHERKQVASGDDTGRNDANAVGYAGKGKFANNTPWKGAGAQKRAQNDPKRDDRRIKNYNDHARAERRKAVMDG